MFKWPRRKSHTQVVIDLWNSEDSAALDYYDKAESQAWLDRFWQSGSPFLAKFQLLDLTSVLELACGKGRHAAQFIDRAGRVTLFDTSPVAMDACKARFAARANVDYVLSPSGRDLAPIPSKSFTSVLSYNALVHFDAECVFGYLGEIHRVLRPGGRALLHHSAYAKHPRRDLRANPGWRAYMSESTFRSEAQNAGLRIESLDTFPWIDAEITDALTMLIKP